MRWQDKLTPKQLSHARQWMGGTLKGIKRTRKYQVEVVTPIRAGFPMLSQEPCWDCFEVSTALNLEPSNEVAK